MIDTKRIKNDFDFIRKEIGLNIIDEETSNCNDCIFVSYSDKESREIRIIRDRSYYEVETRIGTRYINISHIAKYLFNNQKFRIEYKGFDGYLSLVKDSKRKISMINEYMEKINIEKVEKYFKENTNRIEWVESEET